MAVRVYVFVHVYLCIHLIKDVLSMPFDKVCK